ncbi:hypothetical protein [Methylobacterium nigriterrae]|uniref:hypothetical protein n=1 Tax=Methylobacterium nigriterrae TaxID=3127512 RepID=UPI003013ACAB
MTRPHCFPAPWQVIELADASRVEEATGFPIAACTDVSENVERRSGAGRISKNEARRIAIRIAAIPAMQIAMHELEERNAALAARRRH